MKKISVIIIAIGIFLCVAGFYVSLNTTNDKKLNIDDKTVSSKEKEELLSFLSNKYHDSFELISKDYRYCLIQKENVNNNVELDKNCSKKEIINDIYRLKSKDGIEFYVKRVTLNDNINLLTSLKNSQSSGYYDNYILFYLINKYSSNFISKYNYLKVTDQKIYYGLGIENNDTDMAYQSIDRQMQTSFTKNDSFESFLEKVNNFNFSFMIGFYIKVNQEINGENFQSIIKSFVDNDCYDFGNGITGDNIIIEFNNKRFLNIKNGYLATLYEYKGNVFEKEPIKVYDNSILLNNDSFSSEGITLNKFLAKKSTFFDF